MSKKKIKVIIKRPDEDYGHVAYISNTLSNLQRIVDGYIEVVSYWPDTAIICNENGKIVGLPPNFYLGSIMFGDLIRGTVIVVGVDGEEITDCRMSLDVWRNYLNAWGN